MSELKKEDLDVFFTHAGSISVGYYDPEGMTVLKSALSEVFKGVGITKGNRTKEINDINKNTNALLKAEKSFEELKKKETDYDKEIEKKLKRLGNITDQTTTGFQKFSKVVSVGIDIFNAANKILKTAFLTEKKIYDEQVKFLPVFLSLESAGIRVKNGFDGLRASADKAGMQIKDFATLLTKNAWAVNRIQSSGYNAADFIAGGNREIKSKGLGVSDETIASAMAKVVTDSAFQEQYISQSKIYTRTEQYLKQLKLLSQATGKTVEQLIEEQDIRKKSIQLQILSKNPAYRNKIEKLQSMGFSDEVVIGAATGMPNKEMALLAGLNRELYDSLLNYNPNDEKSYTRLNNAAQNDSLTNLIQNGRIYYGALNNEGLQPLFQNVTSGLSVNPNPVSDANKTDAEKESNERIKTLQDMEADYKQFINALDNAYQKSTEDLKEWAKEWSTVMGKLTEGIDKIKEKLGDFGSLEQKKEVAGSIWQGIMAGASGISGITSLFTLKKVSDIAKGMPKGAPSDLGKLGSQLNTVGATVAGAGAAIYAGYQGKQAYDNFKNGEYLEGTKDTLKVGTVGLGAAIGGIIGKVGGAKGAAKGAAYGAAIMAGINEVSDAAGEWVGDYVSKKLFDKDADERRNDSLKKLAKLNAKKNGTSVDEELKKLDAALKKNAELRAKENQQIEAKTNTEIKAEETKKEEQKEEVKKELEGNDLFSFMFNKVGPLLEKLVYYAEKNDLNNMGGKPSTNLGT